jgi:hypothetical protein
MVQGAEDAGKSEGCPVMGQIGLAVEQEIPNLKRCRLPVGLDGKETRGVSSLAGMLGDENTH